MDTFLVDYLESGKAWLLVGSGPSAEMGYPCWDELSSEALSLLRVDRRDTSIVNEVQELHRLKRYPDVFQKVGDAIGAPRLLQVLRNRLIARDRISRIYGILARWPIPVYLTTNYDDEIHNHLVKVSESYSSLTNSPDHLALLLPHYRGSVVKLHGDLRSNERLVLTKDQYTAIEKKDEWRYWRTKLTSIFQMVPVVVIGHSLTDPNVRHVLQAAQEGAGVEQPVCWIAPDVPEARVREYLEKFRIRVVSYDNPDGTHRNLVRLLEHIDQFVWPRTSIGARHELVDIAREGAAEGAAAAGFFVFNRLSATPNIDERRIGVLLAALEASVPVLEKRSSFSLNDALEIAGWPPGCALSPSIAKALSDKASAVGLFQPSGNVFTLGLKAREIASRIQNHFEQAHQRFLQAVQLRIARDYQGIGEEERRQLAVDIDAALTGYFRRGGVTLASMIFSHRSVTARPIPRSILRFITEASARYSSNTLRQAFTTTSIGLFARGEDAEREYLGQVAHGFIAFHGLGAIDDVGLERIRHAMETVWIIDSEMLIVALAIGSPTNLSSHECLVRLSGSGIRLFTTEGIYVEVVNHLRFANKIVERHGVESPEALAATRGQPPFRKENEFLVGYYRWRAAGNPGDWASYLMKVFGSRKPGSEDIKKTLGSLGVEVVSIDAWPGFTREEDFNERDILVERIVNEMRGDSTLGAEDVVFIQAEHERKAKPEAEAVLIVLRERDGRYRMLVTGPSQAWFISHTGTLDRVANRTPVTWVPEGFYAFADTLYPVVDSSTGERAFQTLLWSFARAGVCLLREEDIATVFGGYIDQVQIDIAEQRDIYRDSIEKKYGATAETIIQRAVPSIKPLVAVQLAREAAQELARAKKEAEEKARREEKRASDAEALLKKLETFRRKMEKKSERGRRRAKKNLARAAAKKRK